MTKRKSRSKVQNALREFRVRAGFTQGALARTLNVTTQTATLWETRRDPTGIVLERLTQMARKAGYSDLEAVFAEAVANLPPLARKEIEQQRIRWAALDARVAEIQTEAEKLKEAGNASGKIIYDNCNDLWALLDEIWQWSWRTQK